jgi:hypothetical protein
MTALPVAAFADDEYVCMIGNVGYRSFEQARDSAVSGDTIKLLTNIDYLVSAEISIGGELGWLYVPLYIYGKSLTIDTNGFRLTLGQGKMFYGPDFSVFSTSYQPYGIWVRSGGKLNIVDSSTLQTGQVNATGYRPVRVDGIGSEATVTNVFGVDRSHLLAEDGGSITVTGDFVGSVNATARAESGSSITIMGNIICETSAILSAAGERSSIELSGDITAGGEVSIQATGNSQVTISGTTNTSPSIYLGPDKDNTALYAVESGVSSSVKPGYYEYTDGDNYVYTIDDGSIIGDRVGAPGSGDLYGRGHASMDVALTAVRVVVGVEANLTPAQFAAIDMDFDGVLTMTDVLLIMRKACGL